MSLTTEPDEAPALTSADYRALAGVYVPCLLHWHIWVHRRVDSVEILTDRRMIRNVSVDFTVPRWVVRPDESTLPGHASDVVVLPISLIRKGVLRGFDLRDDDDRHLPILTAEQNIQIGQNVLLLMALRILRRHKPSLRLGSAVMGQLERIISTTTESDGLSELASFQALHSDGEDTQRSVLWDDLRFMTLARDLASSFPLSVVCRRSLGSRGVIRYRLEEDYSSRPKKHPRLEFARVLLSVWKPVILTFDIPANEAGNSESFHLEVPTPEGTFATEASLVKERPSAEVTGSSQPYFDRPPAESQFNVETVHFMAHGVPRGTLVGVRVRIGLLAAGLVTPILFGAYLTLGVFAGGLLLHSAGVRPQTGISPAVVLALNGVLTIYLIRPAEHRLVTELAFKTRAMVALLTAASFGGAGLLATSLAGTPRLAIWIFLTVTVSFATAGISATWYASWHSPGRG